MPTNLQVNLDHHNQRKESPEEPPKGLVNVENFVKENQAKENVNTNNVEEVKESVSVVLGEEPSLRFRPIYDLSKPEGDAQFRETEI